MIKNRKLGFRVLMVVLVALLLSLSIVGCTSPAPEPTPAPEPAPTPEPTPTPEPEPDKGPLVFADLGWDSAQVHNRVAGFILEHGYGYQPDYIPGETIPLFQGLIMGDIDIEMECWVVNQQEAYDKAIADGTIVDLGICFPDSWQGWLVPTYLIEGDAERGIEAMAPDLKSVDDLPDYWELFPDPEQPGKGIFYSCIAGWECEIINEAKFAAYGLDEYYNVFLPGSGAALAASIAGAYEKGEPWFGYYWSPTWVLGKYDMTHIGEPAYDEAVWDDNYACAYPNVETHILVSSALPDTAPDVVSFLENYESTAAQTNSILAYMEDNDATTDEAAIWFLQEYESLWTGWVSGDIAGKVTAELP